MRKIFTVFMRKNQFFSKFSIGRSIIIQHKFIKKSLYCFSSSNDQKSCQNKNCGCSGPIQESDKEKEFKSLNYKILQCINLGHYEEGIELSDKYILEVENFYGKDHPFYCSAINNKAFILKTCGEFDEARILYEEASVKYKNLYSEKSEKYIITMQNLSTVYRDLKNTAMSLEIYENIMKILQSETKNIVQPNILANIYLTAAGNYRSMKRYDDCDKLLNDSLKLVKDNYGEKNLPIATIFNNMGLNFKDQEKYDQALKFYNLSLEIREEFLDKTHPDVIAVKHNIGQLYFDKGEKDQAMKYFNNNLEILNKKESSQHETKN